MVIKHLLLDILGDWATLGFVLEYLSNHDTITQGFNYLCRIFVAKGINYGFIFARDKQCEAIRDDLTCLLLEQA